jgi:hypothetical protein
MTDPTTREADDSDEPTAAEMVTAGDADNDDAHRQGVFNPVATSDEATDEAGRVS